MPCVSDEACAGGKKGVVVCESAAAESRVGVVTCLWCRRRRVYSAHTPTRKGLVQAVVACRTCRAALCAGGGGEGEEESVQAHALLPRPIPRAPQPCTPP